MLPNPIRQRGTFRQRDRKVPEKGEKLGKGVCKHRKNVHFCRLQGRKPLTPMPPAGGSLRGHGSQKGKSVKTNDNVHHMHIELTPEQYATLNDKAKKSGLTKRAFIVRLLEEREIRELPSEELRQLRTEIHQIGNNVNQIARSVNAGIANADDARRGLCMLEGTVH